MARLSEFLLQGSSPVCSYQALLLLGISLVVLLVVTKKSGPCRAEVKYGGRKYRVPGVFDNKTEAERARDLLILVMHQLGIIPASSSRVPALQHPRSSYYLPGLSVLSITNDMRVRLAKALGVSESTINKIACISVQDETRVSTTTTADGRVFVGVTTRDGMGYAFNKWMLCSAEQMGFVLDDWIAYHCDMLFIAFASIMPRNFDGCIWDVEQHAKSQAQPGMLMRYEYMHYWLFLRRLAVQHVVRHWEVFKKFAQADHANALPEYAAYNAQQESALWNKDRIIGEPKMKFAVSPMTMSSSGDYQEWITTYSWPGVHRLGVYGIIASIIVVEPLALFFWIPPLKWGAGPMAEMLWLMGSLYIYSWPGRYTEALALCDLFQCCAYVDRC